MNAPDDSSGGLVPGATIGDRWELTDELTKGGQAESWKAVDLESGDTVAIKMLALHQTADWESIELFERSAEVLETLEHPQVPTYLDAFHETDDVNGVQRYCLVREFIDGEDLESLLETEGAIEAESARVFLTEMLEILHYLHGHSPPIIHRDIKPANIILTPDDTIVLVDFGASQQSWEMSLGGGTSVGTIGYVPPEQMSGSVRPASDLYALGATLVHLLTRTHPSELPVERLKLQFRDRVDVGDDLAELLDKLLEPDPDDRPASARKALELLESGLAQQALKRTDRAGRPTAAIPIRPGEVDRATLLSRGDDFVQFYVPGRRLGPRIAGHAPFWATALALGVVIGSIKAVVGAVIYAGIASFLAKRDDAPYVVQLSKDGLRVGRHLPTAGRTFSAKGAGWSWDADDVDDALAGPLDDSEETTNSKLLAPLRPTFSIDLLLAHLERFGCDRKWLAAEWTRIQEW